MKRKMLTFVQSLLIVLLCFGCAQQRLVKREYSGASNRPQVETGPSLQKKIQIIATGALVGMLGGAIIVETIFNYPGLASLMVDAVTSRDMPLLQACAMLFGAAFLTLVLVADVCAILSNPRLREA